MLDRARAVCDNRGMPKKNTPKSQYMTAAPKFAIPYDFSASDRRRKIVDMARRMCEIDGALAPEEAFELAEGFVDYEARWMAQQQSK